jgi:5-methylcytosine-specific restriction endonuclease McrA
VKRKPLARRSQKTEAKYVERRELVRKVLTERPHCQACKVFAIHDGLVVFRQNASQDVHEIIRRSQGGSILDESNVLAVCRKCHNRIGNYPQLAFDLGLAKHGWERDK